MRVLCLAALLVFTAAGPVFAAQAVALRPAGDVARAAVRLSDVFAGLPADKDADIALAPGPGKSVTYDARVLAALAARHNVAWKPQGLDDRIVLTRPAAIVTSEMVRAKIADMPEVAALAERGIVDVQIDTRGQGLVLAADGALTFDITGFEMDPASRRFSATVTGQAGGAPQSQRVMGRVLVKREIPVLARRIEAGTQIGARDIALAIVSEDRIGTDTVTASQQLVGMEVRRSHNEGETLRTRDILPPRLVTRGATVTLKVETPTMLITAQGRSLQDGGAGESVRVTNTQTNRVVEGIVESAGIVRVGGQPQRLAQAAR